MHGRAGGAGGATSSGARYATRLTPAGPVIVDPNIGGRIQIKLGFEAGTLQLIVTIVCAAGLTLRANGAARNPYVKVRLLMMHRGRAARIHNNPLSICRYFCFPIDATNRKEDQKL